MNYLGVTDFLHYRDTRTRITFTVTIASKGKYDHGPRQYGNLLKRDK